MTGPDGTGDAPRVLTVSGYDSFLRVSALIGEVFARQGAEVSHGLLQTHIAQITRRQIEAAGVSGNALARLTLDQLCDPAHLARYDIIVASLTGASFRRLFLRLENHKGRRPLIAAIYPGIILRYPFDGLASRAPADLLWLNSPRDLELYREMCAGLGERAGNAAVLGPAVLLSPVKRRRAASGPVVFFEQTIIPRSVRERRFLAARLLRLARDHPERQFLVKPRTAPHEFTLHPTRAHIVPLLRQEAAAAGGWPDNFEVVYASPRDLLSRASHCLTISSTVAIEAIHAGVPTTLISDFGVNDDFGLQYFFGSGLIASFDQLNFEAPAPAAPARSWRRTYLADPNRTIDKLVAHAFELVQKNRAGKHKYRDVVPYFGSPGFMRALHDEFSLDDIGRRKYQRGGRFRARVANATAFIRGLLGR